MARNIELYYLPWSYHSLKARMYLAEKGVTPKLNIVDVTLSENLTEDFIRLSPQAEIPVLKTSNAVVPDIEEIYRYGEDNIAGDNLIPADIADDVWKFHDLIHKVDMKVPTYGCFAHFKFLADIDLPEKQKKAGEEYLSKFIQMLTKKLPTAAPAVTPLISSMMQKMKDVKEKVDDEKLVDEAIESVSVVLNQCEEQLSKSDGPFLFGATVTIADIDLIVLIARARLVGLKARLMPQDRCEKLSEFITAMERRKSYSIMSEDCQSFGKHFRADYRPLFIFLGAAAAAVVLGVAVGIAITQRKRW